MQKCWKCKNLRTFEAQPVFTGSYKKERVYIWKYGDFHTGSFTRWDIGLPPNPPDQPPLLKIWQNSKACPVGRVVHQDSNPSRTMILTTCLEALWTMTLTQRGQLGFWPFRQKPKWDTAWSFVNECFIPPSNPLKVMSLIT